jgi:hypothetical protein
VVFQISVRHPLCSLAAAIEFRSGRSPDNEFHPIDNLDKSVPVERAAPANKSSALLQREFGQARASLTRNSSNQAPPRHLNPSAFPLEYICLTSDYT